MSSQDKLNEECVQIVEELMKNYQQLQPDNDHFGVQDPYTGHDVMRDLVKLIKNSQEIKKLHSTCDFGK